MSPTVQSSEEAYRFLKITPNPDGSITRLESIPNLPPTPEIDPAAAAESYTLSKDVPLSASKNTFIRLFRPANPPSDTKLPLLIYFHGGGFVFYSASTIFFHHSCNKISANIPALIASVDYRLAPEHRLPAAYEDAEEALMWIRDQALGENSDPWLDIADFSRIFLIGSSAGGNIVYHTALRALDLDLAPLKIVGLIMHQAYFGGLQRTESEIRLINDQIVPLHAADLMWSLALPEGADRGHKYCDPFVDEFKEKIGKLPACLVRGYTGDPLVDRQKQISKVLQAAGVKVVAEFIDGGEHAVELFDANAALATLQSFTGFVLSVPSGNPVNKDTISGVEQ